MKYSRLVMVGVICVIALICAPTASASIVPLLVSGANSFEDDDFESVVVGGADGILHVGDRVFGVFRVQNINGTVIGAADPTLTAVFAVEVISKVGADGSATRLDFGPLQSGGMDAAIAQWTALTGSLGVTTQIPTDDSTMVMLYRDAIFGATSVTGTLASSVDTFDETAGIFLAEYGFNGSVGEIFATTGQAGVDVPANVVTPLFAAINTLGLSALVDNPTDGLEMGFLSGQGTFVKPPNPPNPGVWQLATDTDLIIDIRFVPEPAMAVIFGGLFALAALRRHSRDAA